ncbi:MAG TPA: LysE family translocator [Terriglobales bacterium]|nr:LysE family translocator [Terriglobales bacterium]
MLQMQSFELFLAAAVVLAITPGPGIFYVLTRTLAGGRRDGFLSAGGTLLGGLFHVFAAALGVSAILAASAVAFAVVKYAGAAYLVYLGIRMIRSRDFSLNLAQPSALKGTFRQGIATEVLNPKTALFFLSFIPQFIHPERGHVFAQFVMLGAISVGLNTSADIAVAFLGGALGKKLKQSTRLMRRQRLVSGLAMIGLGVYVAAAGDAK